MAIDLWWLGDATETTATICLRSTVNGEISLIVNGQTFTGDTTDTAISDGVGKVVATGLLSNKKYSFTVTVGGSTVTGTLKTMPGSGDSYNFMWGSCIEQGNYDSLPGLKKLISEYDPAIFLFQGDMYYPESGKGFGNRAWGGNTPTVVTSANRTDSSNAYTAIRMSLHNPFVKNLIQSQPFYWMWDDHEAYNDFNLHRAIGGWPTGLHPTYTDMVESSVELYETYIGAVKDYCLGNPLNSDAGIDAGALNPAYYWRKTIGNIEFFQVDVLSYKSDQLAVDDINKRLLGSTQESWLTSKVSASSSDFKMVSFGKSLFHPNSGGNEDSYPPVTGITNSGFQTERTRLINALGAVTTTALITGDMHNPLASFATPDVGTYSYTGKLLNVVASPMCSTPYHAAKGATTEDDYIRYVSNSDVNNYFDKYCCVGLGEYNASNSTLTLSILSMDGTKRVSYTLGVGSNEPI